jgi:hypothetical protein
METLIVEARENILSNEYGKFDLIETLFPLEILLTQKPRQIRKLICSRLSVQSEQVNYECLRSWLRRLKKKHSAKQFKKEKALSNSNDWRNFTPPENPTPDSSAPVKVTLIK